jgi:iron complex transport system ATP-binding protein
MKEVDILMDANAPALSVRELICGYGKRAVTNSISFELDPSQIMSVLGPNGVGKTTLFKTLLGFLCPLSGSIFIGGRDTSAWSRKEFAKEVAYIPQLHVPSFSYAVHDVVLMGRTPHLQGLSSPGETDEEIVEEVLEKLEIQHLSARDYASLSGGERQMVLVARALAARPQILVMDEPCASLDLGNQALLLEQILDLSSAGMIIVMTTHDPNHALLLGGAVMCLGCDGQVIQGEAAEVLDSSTLSELYGVPVAFGGACMPLLKNKGGK